ncbi:erythromycin esterase family protein [Ramlibacter sp. MAHUQ-53]|uniref:erythromycin esterase family protein n=1 Tax=unclassified Ramlibacter TaxID=2617605 RepID=UPI00363830DA
MNAPRLRPPEADLPDAIAPHARPLARPADEDALLDFIAQGRIVLLGEATHGTHEFYALRAALTRRLIVEHGFTAVVAEADWPDAWRVNRYVRGVSEDGDAAEALAGFERFPAWMWRNTVVREFVEWLHLHNATHPHRQQAGFYGMDLYSLHRSIQAVLAYLDRTDPEAARRARARYACFDHQGGDSEAYGYGASIGLRPSCEDEVVDQLRELNRHLAAHGYGASAAREEAFHAQQNARLVRNAEAYYRTMFHRRASSWNLRDSHMAETLQAVERHLATEGGPSPRLVVWAHNSHLGDARATQMGLQGEWNVGQLARERWGAEVMSVGMTTFCGTVTAAAAWDEPAHRRRVREGLPGSCEALGHETAHVLREPQFWLPLRGHPPLEALLDHRRLQRAIGVVYLPSSERASHYFDARLPAQFDALVHIDQTRALEPLEPASGWVSGTEPPETYPSGL